MVRTLDSQSKGSMFNSELFHFHVATFGQLFTHALQPDFHAIYHVTQQVLASKKWHERRKVPSVIGDQHSYSCGGVSFSSWGSIIKGSSVKKRLKDDM